MTTTQIQFNSVELAQILSENLYACSWDAVAPEVQSSLQQTAVVLAQNVLERYAEQVSFPVITPTIDNAVTAWADQHAREWGIEVKEVLSSVLERLLFQAKEQASLTAFASALTQWLDNQQDAIQPVLNRETLGRIAREIWVKWAKHQPDPKPSWLKPWEELEEEFQEADRQIGEGIAHYVLVFSSGAYVVTPPLITDDALATLRLKIEEQQNRPLINPLSDEDNFTRLAGRSPAHFQRMIEVFQERPLESEGLFDQILELLNYWKTKAGSAELTVSHLQREVSDREIDSQRWTTFAHQLCRDLELRWEPNQAIDSLVLPAIQKLKEQLADTEVDSVTQLGKELPRQAIAETILQELNRIGPDVKFATIRWTNQDDAVVHLYRSAEHAIKTFFEVNPKYAEYSAEKRALISARIQSVLNEFEIFEFSLEEGLFRVLRSSDRVLESITDETIYGAVDELINNLNSVHTGRSTAPDTQQPIQFTVPPAKINVEISTPSDINLQSLDRILRDTVQREIDSGILQAQNSPSKQEIIETILAELSIEEALVTLLKIHYPGIATEFWESAVQEIVLMLNEPHESVKDKIFRLLRLHGRIPQVFTDESVGYAIDNLLDSVNPYDLSNNFTKIASIRLEQTLSLLDRLNLEERLTIINTWMEALNGRMPRVMSLNRENAIEESIRMLTDTHHPDFDQAQREAAIRWIKVILQQISDRPIVTDFNPFIYKAGVWRFWTTDDGAWQSEQVLKPYQWEQLSQAVRNAEQSRDFKSGIGTFEKLLTILRDCRDNEAKAIADRQSLQEDVLTWMRAMQLMVETASNGATHSIKQERYVAVVEMIESAIKQLREAHNRYLGQWWERPDIFRSDYPTRHFLKRIQELEREVKALQGNPVEDEIPL